MALNKLAGAQGYLAKNISSMNGRAIGKLTDTNHLSSLISTQPAKYDKDIIEIYSQTSLFSNDFLDMINKSEPYYIKGNTDTWQWKIAAPYQFVKLLPLPEATMNNPSLGEEQLDFEVVFDRDYFRINDIITANRQKGDALVVTYGPIPYSGGGFLYKVANTRPGLVNRNYLVEGTEYMKLTNVIGEFDQELGGLDKLADEIVLYESLSAGYGVSHTVTKWADQRVLKDKDGRPLDILMYGKYRRNELGKPEITGIRWEPVVEMLLRKEMLKSKVNQAIWGKGGTAMTRGSSQEVKKIAEGVYPKIVKYGNYVPFPKGSFNIPMIRSVIGDLFYRRTAFKDRKVKLFTNEAGIKLFRQANKDDLLSSGLTLTLDMKQFGDSPQTYGLNPGFDLLYTMETGKMEVSHLMELDLPQTQSEFGSNKMSPPIFFIFDLTSPDGGMNNNIREVRLEGAPSMTWGYIDGRQHHLGFAASQGMSSSSMKPGYDIWFEDRTDIFIEDLSRCVVIEEI